jgi:hypothetical protein
MAIVHCLCAYHIHRYVTYLAIVHCSSRILKGLSKWPAYNLTKNDITLRYTADKVYRELPMNIVKMMPDLIYV